MLSSLESKNLAHPEFFCGFIKGKSLLFKTSCLQKLLGALQGRDSLLVSSVRLANLPIFRLVRIPQNVLDVPVECLDANANLKGKRGCV